MSKRILSLILTFCMLLSILPTGLFAYSGEELYLQMLELGITDADGSLIEENSFTLDDGTKLSSLTELERWLSELDENEMGRTITVDSTGRSATAEQMIAALSIEYGMTDLSAQLNLIAQSSSKGFGNDDEMIEQSTYDTTAHEISMECSFGPPDDRNISVFAFKFTDAYGNVVTFNEDVCVEAGVFADFLNEGDNIGSNNITPAVNSMGKYVMPAGQSSILFEIDFSKFQRILAERNISLDGNDYILFQARSHGNNFKDCSLDFILTLAPQSEKSEIINAITGGTEDDSDGAIVIGRQNSDKTQIIPYHFDWKSANIKDTVTIKNQENVDKEFYKVEVPIPIAKGSDSGNENSTYGWMDSFNTAINIGIGDESPKVKIQNLTLWSKEDVNSHRVTGYTICCYDASGELINFNNDHRVTFRKNGHGSYDSYPDYLPALTKVQDTNWDLSEEDAKNKNFYKQMYNYTWQGSWLGGVTVPISQNSSSTGSPINFPTTWYLSIDWITNNANKNTPPEEILIHGLLTLVDKTSPTIEDIYCPIGNSTFYFGDYIPIVVEFSEPVYGDYDLVYNSTTDDNKNETYSTLSSSDVALNSIDLAPIKRQGEVLSSRRLFLYPVDLIDANVIMVAGVKAASLNCTDIFGNTFNADKDHDYQVKSKTFASGNIISAEPKYAFFQDGIFITATEDPCKFSVDVHTSPDFKTALANFNQPVMLVIDGDVDNAVKLESHSDDTNSYRIYSGEFTLDAKYDINVSSNGFEHVAEIYYGEKITDSQASDGEFDISDYTLKPIYGVYEKFDQYVVKTATESSYTISADSWYSGTEGTIYRQDAIVPTFSYELGEYDFSYNSTDKLYWKSSNEQVIEIQTKATHGSTPILQNYPTINILTKGEGEADLYLVATNNTDNESNHTVASNKIHIKVVDGGTPFIIFPSNANTIYARQGETLKLSFSSNLAEHPAGDGKDGKITAKLKWTSGGEPQEYILPSLDRSAESIEIDGSLLQQISSGENPSYTLELSSTALIEGDDTPRDLTTSAYIIVRSQPAAIELTGLDSPYFTSDDQINVGWQLDNFDLENNPDDCVFSLKIEKNGAVIFETDDPDYNGSGSGSSYSGSYTITPDITDLHEYYIITAKAKNIGDPTWSISSKTVTVYKSGALDILLGGEKLDEITLKNTVNSFSTTTSPTITNYDGNTFGGLTNAQAIAKLRSELGLLESISINFNDYEWNIVNDTIMWSTSTGSSAMSEDIKSAVTLNFLQGRLYAPIESYSYLYYLPQTIFLLSGLRNGSETITATHNKVASLTSEVKVNVELLYEKLYLFQFTPAIKTEISYIDGLGNPHTLYSNDDGSLALFEPNGIASDLNAASVSGGSTYRGTIMKQLLKSGEGNGIYNELYPLNAVELRPGATAEITLLKPDGSPLSNTAVTLRGGVYRNSYLAIERDDAYCTSAKFAKSEGVTANLDGKVDQTFTTDKNGVLTVHMDLSQFISANDPEPVGVGDSLEFIFELRFANDEYQPEIITVDGSLTKRDTLRSGEDIVTLTKANGKKPFVAVQTINYTGRKIDVRTHTGVVGPSSSYPEAILDTKLMLWGTNAKLEDSGYTFDLRARETKVSIPDQEITRAYNASYPFSSIPLIDSSVRLTSDSFVRYNGAKKTPLEAAVFDRNGGMVSTIAIPFGLADLTAIEKVEDSKSLVSLMANLAIYGKVGGADTESQLVNSVSNAFLGDALSFVEKLGSKVGAVKAVLMPTEDPTRYSAYLWTGIDTTELDDLDYNSNGVSIEPSYIGQDTETLLDSVSISDHSLSDFQAMADGSYFKNEDGSSDLASKAVGAIGLPVMLVLEGWVSTEIRYNFDKGEWQVITTGGGFKTGAQVEFERSINLTAYGIPLTASFTLGGGVVIDFQTAIRYSEQLGLEWNDKTAKAVNDYLTALRLNAYFEFFGGIGFDKGFTAKIGAYGSVKIDNENRFLTRNYLKDPNQRDVRGQALWIEGEAGIKGALGVGPFVIEVTLASVNVKSGMISFNKWKDIDEYWENATNGLGSTGHITPASMYSENLIYLDGSTALLVSEPTVKLQSRDYLDEGYRLWLGGDSSIGMMALDPQSVLSAIETNSYPYSNPMISDDGKLLVYLSDADSSDVTDVEVRFAKIVDGYDIFDEGNAIPASDNFDGYGDSSLDFDGDSKHAAAIWLREAATLNLAADTVLTQDQQKTLLNGLEVVASIWNGSEWTTTRLTDNGSQELEPSIAINDNGQAIAVWRSVQSGENPLELTQNRILCKLYDGSSWSEAYTLYNGNAGEVTGLTAELSNNGTAAVAFSVEKDTSRSDIYYTVANINSNDFENDAKTICTTDSYSNTDPKLTTVSYENDELFVLGWSSINEISGIQQHDVGLRAFDKSGAPKDILPESLSDLVSTSSFDGKFTFVKGADTLDSLSILWNDSNAGSEINDIIRAVKFGRYGTSKKYSSSAPIEVAALPANTSLDSFDAYAIDQSGETIKAVIQATTVSTTEFDTVNIEYTIDGTTYTEAANIPKETVNLLSATESYEDKVEVISTTVDFSTLAANSYLPIPFLIKNSGFNPISSAAISIGGERYEFNELSLLPNQTKTLSVAVKTGDVIEDLDYTLTANFDSHGDKTADGTVYLDYPDIGISSLRVTSEEEGIRTLLATLYNQSAASLAKAGRQVILGVYSDPDCEKPIDDKYFENGNDITLNGDALSSIDNGGYTTEIKFDLGSYVKDAGLDEIPSEGVTIFVRARIEENGKTRSSEPITLPEADSLNNQKNVTLDSLLTRNSGEVTTMTVELENGETTTASFNIRNNSLLPRSSGSLTAALLDDDGSILEIKSIGNIDLNGEEAREMKISFSKRGANVAISYGEAVSTDSSNAKPSAITVSGLPVTLESFDENNRATVAGVANGSYILSIIPENSSATIKVNGEKLENGMTELVINGYDETFEITIIAPDGKTKCEYELTLKTSEPFYPIIIFNTLSFESNGGSTIEPIRKFYSSSISLDGYIPTREGYVFTGWYSDSSLTTRISEVKLINDITVYAGWKPIAVEPPIEPVEPVDPIGPILPDLDPDIIENPFTDIFETDWFYGDVMYAYANGLMNGVSTTTFAPALSTTRGMIVTILHRLEGKPAAKSECSFEDVRHGEYYEEAIAWAAENGIVTGHNSKNFAPDDPITREQLAVILYRYAKLKGINTDIMDISTVFTFDDLDDISSYAFDAMQWACCIGLINGTTPTTLSPQGEATRAQVSAILHRFIG